MGAIEHAVEALDKCMAVNKVKALASARANVGNDEIYGIRITRAIQHGVEKTRPYLAVKGKTEDLLCKMASVKHRLDHYYTLHSEYTPEAMERKVVPLSMIPAVESKIIVGP
ncbi:hypothetical protein BDR07DRAFT_1375557 [Suillus spraguei]|nr:hypothetical protein BDR07DRAFT_1375557 [Suillus spraguei]